MTSRSAYARSLRSKKPRPTASAWGRERRVFCNCPPGWTGSRRRWDSQSWTRTVETAGEINLETVGTAGLGQPGSGVVIAEILERRVMPGLGEGNEDRLAERSR